VQIFGLRCLPQIQIVGIKMLQSRKIDSYFINRTDSVLIWECRRMSRSLIPNSNLDNTLDIVELCESIGEIMKYSINSWTHEKKKLQAIYLCWSKQQVLILENLRELRNEIMNCRLGFFTSCRVPDFGDLDKSKVGQNNVSVSKEDRLSIQFTYWS
jgi:hypothetical protein